MNDTRLSVIVVDDEEPARLLLREYLSTHEDIEIIAECANGFEAVKAITGRRPDLLLLDVQMPKLDGFEVLDLVGEGITVIFVTAYDSYAIRAFDVHAVDYLLKPFSAERFDEALTRARARMRSVADVAQGFHPAASPVADLLSSRRAQHGPIERLLIRDRGDVHVVPASKIDYIESQDDYVAVKALGKSFLKEQTLADLEALLDGTRFVRIHRRYILNVARLARIEQSITESRVAVLTDGTELPISKAGYARLRELL